MLTETQQPWSKTIRRAIVATLREASQDGQFAIPYDVAMSIAGRYNVTLPALRDFARQRRFEIVEAKAPPKRSGIPERKRTGANIPDRIPETVLRSLERGTIYRMLTDDPDSFVLTTRSQWRREREVIARLVQRYRADLASSIAAGGGFDGPTGAE